MKMDVKFTVPEKNAPNHAVMDKRMDVEKDIFDAPTLRLKFILNELAKSGYLSPLQFEVKDVFLTEEICYIDLTSTSIKNVKSILDEVDMVNCIVKTVFVNFDNIREVMMLIDDKPADVLVRFYDISIPFRSSGDRS